MTEENANQGSPTNTANTAADTAPGRATGWRWQWRWPLITLLALAVGLGVPWAVRARQQSIRTHAALRASQQMAFSGFLTQVENLEVLLAKTLASTARDRQIMLLSRVAAEADGAGLNLAQLPSAGHNLGVTQKFLKQVSGYTQLLAQQMAAGKPLDTRQRDTLAELHNLAGQIAQALHTTGRPGAPARAPGAAVPAQAGQTQSIEAPPSPEAVRAWLEIAAQQLEAFPGLVYDGPFSEHLEQLKPKPLPGSAISSSQAAEIARSFFGFGPDFRLQSVTAVTGPLPAYSVRLRPPGSNREVVVDVSQAGGHVLWMLDARIRGKPVVDRPRALTTAADFLLSRGFPPVTVTGWLQEGDQLTFSFAPVARRDGSFPDPTTSRGRVDPSRPPGRDLIILYPQTIKVRVSLDTGRIAGLDAVAYWQNSGVRKFPTPRLSPEQVSALVNPGVKVENVSLALIPVGGNREALTYEVRTNMGGDRFLTYYNVETGREEAIFQIQESETVRLAN